MEQLASRQMGENTIDRTANIRARSNYNGCERQLHGLAGARRAAASRDAGVRAPVLAAGAAALLVADGRHEEGLHGRAGARRAAASLDAGVPAPVLAASAAALLVADGRHEEGLHGRAGARRAAASRDAGVPAPVLAAGAAALLVADGRREEGLHALAGARRAAASRDAGVPAPVLAAGAAALLVADSHPTAKRGSTGGQEPEGQPQAVTQASPPPFLQQALRHSLSQTTSSKSVAVAGAAWLAAIRRRM
ncbi:unnamed protein product [Prorocentrum cordatum]|uniref:Uncharacterized protein n=1 Tax=Prorocentrum cordatum TaxID=2364126 RepID=A0ABN9QF65_9DINO|nr:unnamed protein product [Polarella glacialis]